MSKSINKGQSEMLLEKMLQKPDIAKGFVKENRDKVADYWKQLTLSLNSLGPPVKSEFEWKKVWNDQKRYVRKKASENKMYERGTGGGPNKTKKLTSAEEAIFQLLDMKECVDGIETSQCYGLPAKKAKINSDLEILSDIVIQCEEVPGCSTDLLTSIPGSEPFAPQCERECSQNDTNRLPVLQSRQNANDANKSKKITSSELVLKELETQKELCGKLDEIVSEIKPHNSKMQYYAENSNRILERICDLKEKN